MLLVISREKKFLVCNYYFQIKKCNEESILFNSFVPGTCCGSVVYKL